MSGAFFGERPVHDAYAWMRRHAPVFYDEANDLWAVSRYRDIKAVSTDTATFSNAGGIRPKFPPLPMMIDFDAPEHVRRRRLVSAGFTPRRVREMEDHVRAICDRVIDAVCERGECDFVTDVAAPLPLAVIGDMLGRGRGRPGRPPALVRGDAALPGTPTPESHRGRRRGLREYTAYMDPVIETRRHERTRRRPGRGAGATPRSTATASTTTRSVHETLLILVGGDETTRHVITGGHAGPAAPTPTSWPGSAGRPARCSRWPSRRCCAG